MPKPSLKDKVLGKGKKLSPEKELALIHHTLMKEYGWISLEELKKVPIETISNLMYWINKEREAENKANQPKGKR